MVVVPLLVFLQRPQRGRGGRRRSAASPPWSARQCCCRDRPAATAAGAGAAAAGHTPLPLGYPRCCYLPCVPPTPPRSMVEGRWSACACLRPSCVHICVMAKKEMVMMRIAPWDGARKRSIYTHAAKDERRSWGGGAVGVPTVHTPDRSNVHMGWGDDKAYWDWGSTCDVFVLYVQTRYRPTLETDRRAHHDASSFCLIGGEEVEPRGLWIRAACIYQTLADSNPCTRSIGRFLTGLCE